MMKWQLLTATLFLMFQNVNAGIDRTTRYINGFQRHHDSTYSQKIQPIFDKRCVGCHACYTSPCNLKLTSYEGVLRGGNRVNRYSRKADYKSKIDIIKSIAASIPPMRMKDPWMGVSWEGGERFNPVIPVNSTTRDSYVAPQTRVDRSLLMKFINLGADNNIPGEESFKSLSSPANNKCTIDAEEFEQKKNSEDGDFKYHGMPFGLARLPQEEIDTIRDWIKAGAAGYSQDDFKKQQPSDEARPLVNMVESFLNADNITDPIKRKKMGWTAKYLYEHLYLTHIHHDSAPGEFFELVRSSTPPGQKINEIVTTFPYDKIAGGFFYRIRKIHSTIVFKTHITYQVDSKKLEDLYANFIEKDWPIEKTPKEFKEVNWDNSNPFENFAYIPAKSRYRWMLRNSKLVVDTFTRGPVCNGAVATYAVRDNFWVMFLDPESDISLDGKFFTRKISRGWGNGFDFEKSFEKRGQISIAQILAPAAMTMYKHFPAKRLPPLGKFRDRFYKYEEKHAQLLKKARPEGYSNDDIWKGDARNQMLTVYRHNDNVSVHYGALGAIPKTGWVLDYPLFEGIYYSLVASYNVFGQAKYGGLTRYTFEKQRRAAEDALLAFVPQKVRKKARQEWYQSGFISTVWLYAKSILRLLGVNVEIGKKNLFVEKLEVQNDSKSVREFLGYMAKKLDKLDPLNNNGRFAPWKITENALTGIANKRCIKLEKNPCVNGKQFNQFFPDVSVLKVSGRYFTIIKNRFHRIMNVMLEKTNVNPYEDTLDIVEDLVTSFPNQFWQIPEGLDASDFVIAVNNIRDKSDYGDFLKKYGVAKTSSNFWPFLDDLQKHVMKDKVYGGVLDISRYNTN